MVVEHFEVTPARLKSVDGGFYLVKIWGKSVLVESGPVRLCNRLKCFEKLIGLNGSLVPKVYSLSAISP